MDRADLRRKLIEDFDSIIGRTWLVGAETRRIMRAARRVTEENDAWVDTLLEAVNRTYGDEPEEERGDTSTSAFEVQKRLYPTLASKTEDITDTLRLVGYGFSPMIIIAILGLLITAYQACKLTSAKARQRANSPTPLDRIVLRRSIRRVCREYDCPRFEDDTESVEAAILEVAKTVTDKEMKALYEEAKKREV